MGLSNELSCEAGSFSHWHNPHRFLQLEVLRLYLLTLESWVAWSVLLPHCSSQFIHMQMWNCLLHQLPPCPVGQRCLAHPGPPATTCLEFSPPQLPVSAPPTGLHECFFFIWLFFVFKFVAVLLLVVRGGKLYLCLHLGGKSQD